MSKVQDNRGGWLILRDQEGAYRGGVATFLPRATDPEVAEVLAAGWGLKLATELGVQKIQLELDSKGVVSMLNDRSKNLSALGPYIEEIKEMLRYKQEYKVIWTRRTANLAAHVLGKEGVSNDLEIVWPDMPPECILHIIANEIPDVI